MNKKYTRKICFNLQNLCYQSVGSEPNSNTPHLPPISSPNHHLHRKRNNFKICISLILNIKNNAINGIFFYLKFLFLFYSYLCLFSILPISMFVF